MKNATAVIPTRRSLPERAWRAVQRAFVRWQIRTNEQWLRDCEADNCLSPMHLVEVERQQQELRVRLAVLEMT